MQIIAHDPTETTRPRHPALRALQAFPTMAMLLAALMVTPPAHAGIHTIEVASADAAPTVTAPATQTVAENALLMFTVAASDPDGDAIMSLTAAPMPTGSTFTRNASGTGGTFSWTPSLMQAGTYIVVFTAQNALSGTATTVITVTNLDRAPTVTAPATQAGAATTTLSFTVSANDPDGDTITSLTAILLPPGATFAPNFFNTFGTFSWTPSFMQAGTYSVTFTARNALSGSATTAITITGPPTPTGAITGAVFSVPSKNFACGTGNPGPALAGWIVAATDIVSGMLGTTSTNSLGEYALTLPPGQYVITEVVQDLWSQVCPGTLPGAGHVVDVANEQIVTHKDFANTAATARTDLAISIAGGRARPGFQKTYSVLVRNEGTMTTSANPFLDLSLLPGTVTFESVDPPMSGFNNGMVTWPAIQLTPTATALYKVTVLIGASTPIGTLLTVSAAVPRPNDDNQANNTATESEDVRASFDPNEKSVVPSGTVLRTDPLRYQVDFQNLGTAEATFVIVRDVIDENLDLESLSSGAGSHPYLFAVNGRELTWVFPSIDLPPASQDNEGSQGFLTFTARPIAAVPDCEMIRNSAAITFDFNVPVITNEVLSDIACPVLPATIDVDPDTINVSSNGRFVTVYIELPSDFNPTAIDISSLRLDDSIPVESKFAVVGDHDTDGVADLMVKCRRQALAPQLAPGENQIKVGGMLRTGDRFEGSDVVHVIDQGGEALSASVAPNPLNPSGVLAFRTAAPGAVRVRLFDLQGRLIRTLLETTVLPAGRHEVVIDALGARGEALPSGLYFYRLETPNGNISGRFAILK
jgi:uncharacterized repeat protein (TIGR01451 family)